VFVALLAVEQCHLNLSAFSLMARSFRDAEKMIYRSPNARRYGVIIVRPDGQTSLTLPR
jgi:hypothetical protein